VHLLASRKIRIADYVKLDSGEEGYVTDINWRNTSIRQLPNNMIIVPNAKMASAIVTNFYRPQNEMSVLVDVGVDYASDLEHVETVTKEVIADIMRTVPGGVPDHEPVVRFNKFGDWAINFTAVLRAREYADQYLIKHEFVKRLRERYHSEGILIPFPVVRIMPDEVELEEELERLGDRR
jgi:small-conductance mechanosensitive channel